jgi:glycosyltransferase involved in cell wall biosynthesis
MGGPKAKMTISGAHVEVVSRTGKLIAYVLTLNEAPNIAATLESVAALGCPVTVLDSGSTDETLAIVRRYSSVHLEPYAYTSHLKAYRDTIGRHSRSEYVLVLDADMRVPRDLGSEIRQAVAEAGIDVLAAPIEMWWGGLPLPHGSLCPPKPILFRGGESPFGAVGHGERILPDVRVHLTLSSLIHDDRKPYSAFLASQYRYARAMLTRVQKGSLTWRDRLRVHSPLMLLAAPAASLIVRGGFLSGSVGLVYALDRLIAEAVFYRAAVASRAKMTD